MAWRAGVDMTRIDATIAPRSFGRIAPPDGSGHRGIQPSRIMQWLSRKILSTPRAHLATVVAAFAVAGLVTLGVGTGQRASSSSTAGVFSTFGSSSVDVAPSAADRSSLDMDVDVHVGEHEHAARLDGRPVLDRGSIRRIFTGVRSESGLAAIARMLGCHMGTSTADCMPAPVGQAAQVALYNGRPIRPVATLRMKVTAYSPDWRSCGESADGITASGYSVLTNGGFMVAADPRVLPLGSLVSVPGYDGGSVVPVLDTGGAIKGNRLDVLYPTHEVAVLWGVQEIDVTVWDYADGLPNGFRRVRRPVR